MKLNNNSAVSIEERIAEVKVAEEPERNALLMVLSKLNTKLRFCTP
jgi:hypothetical protein